MTSVEKMAREICRANVLSMMKQSRMQVASKLVDAEVELLWKQDLPAAIAALKAIREPDDGMAAAAVAELSDATVEDPKAAAWDWLRAHRAAIDHAIQEHEG